MELLKQLVTGVGDVVAHMNPDCSWVVVLCHECCCKSRGRDRENNDNAGKSLIFLSSYMCQGFR